MLFPIWLITSGSFFSFVADDPVAVTATMIISAMAFQTYSKSSLPQIPCDQSPFIDPSLICIALTDSSRDSLHIQT